MLTHLEDYLETLVGIKQQTPPCVFTLEVNDKVLLASFARQTSRGVGLTDKQMALAKDKILKYSENFRQNSIEVDVVALDCLRIPLRSIDRSKSVSIKSDQNKHEIVIKFPFNKKTIVLVNEISQKYQNFYKHQKGTNEHTFKFFEPIVEDIVDVFSDRNFVIEKEILDFYKEIKEIKNSAHKFRPALIGNKLSTVDSRIIKIAEEEIGALSDKNMIKYYDRFLRYGFEKFEVVSFDNYTELTGKIANRNQQKVYIPPVKFDIDQVTATIAELERFPLVVVLDTNNELEQLKKLFDSIKRYVPSSQQILLDRIENKDDKNYPVNTFIKENNFATWLNDSIKVVYIFQQRLPKLLLKEKWSPITSLQTSGTRMHSYVSTYLESRCDLMIATDDQPSMVDKNNQRKSLYEIL